MVTGWGRRLNQDKITKTIKENVDAFNCIIKEKCPMVAGTLSEKTIHRLGYDMNNRK